MPSNITEIEELSIRLGAGLNGAWLIITGIGILLMQAGFMALEVGLVRAKSVKSAIFKNMFDHSAGAIGWYWVGFNLFIGNSPFASGSDVDWANMSPSFYAKIFQQFGFAVTCATIVSGGIISRCKLEVYIVFAFFLSAYIYPIVAHWCWNAHGFLYLHGFLDFAGSGVVHLLGGSCALVGAKLCGPRVGRFASIEDRSEHSRGDDRRGSEGSEHSEGLFRLPVSNGLPFRYRLVNSCVCCGSNRTWAYNLVDRLTLNHGTLRVRDAPGHSASMQCLGGLLLYVAWFSFNGGSGGAIDSQELAEVAGRATINTMLAAAAGSMTGLMWSELLCSSFDIELAVNTLIGSLVSITAGCGYVEPWAAVVVGILSVPVYVGGSKLVLYGMHVDDPLNAVSVHGACGFLGLVWLGLTHPVLGLFYSGNGAFLGAQLLGGLCIVVWGVANSLLYFCSLKFVILPLVLKRQNNSDVMLDDEESTNLLCYPHDVQLVGLDFFHFGGSAFPDFDTEAVHEYNATERIKKRYMRAMKGPAAGAGKNYVGDISGHGGGGALAAKQLASTSSMKQMVISPASTPPTLVSPLTTPRGTMLPSNDQLSGVFIMENPNRIEEE